jgi:hypothetical protein
MNDPLVRRNHTREQRVPVTKIGLEYSSFSNGGFLICLSPDQVRTVRTLPTGGEIIVINPVLVTIFKGGRSASDPSREDHKGGQMKKQALSVILTLGLFATLAVTAGRAQSSNLLAVVQIPFDFRVKGQTLPTGEYSIRRVSPDSDERLMINSRDGRTNIMFITNNIRAADLQSQGKLVFSRYGDKYFLSQIWMAGSKTGRVLPKSPVERQLTSEEELANSGIKRQRVELAVRTK